MPEGDTIFRTARMLHGALAGQPVTRFQSVFPALTRIDEDHPMAGRTIESVAARGKHLLMSFSGDLVLHTHLRMNGAWHLYHAGERWRRPFREMRIVVSTANADAVGFNIPIAEFLTARQLARHDRLRQLGPDLLDPAFNPQTVIERAAAHGEEPIADLLLNQRVVSGLGNVLKSETLFVARIDPFTRAGNLSTTALEELVAVARRLILMNVLEPTAIAAAGRGRRSINALDPHVRLWVYGRAGKPCRNCGAPIASLKTGLDARVTYWCPRCQPVSRPKEDE
jgi:endonuclease-8